MIPLADIEAARERIRGQVVLSPCSYSDNLSQMLGCEVYFKLENLQKTGSFKDRGALNKMLRLTEDQRKAGVIAASAGNHAQGVAHAARLCQTRAIIVMPETTPLAKLRGTQDLGAEIVLHGRGYDDAFSKAVELRAERGYTLVHAFDDPEIIAGQGTIGLELLEQLPDLDMVIVPVGGGGLISGVAAAIKARRPEVEIIGAEAKRMPAMKESLSSGSVVPLRTANTLADGIAVARVGDHTLPIVQELVSAIHAVDESEIANAVMVLLEREKTLSEGAGAVGFAALYNGHVKDTAGKKVVVLVSGGNIDMTMLSRLLERGLELDGRLARIKVVVPDRPGSIADLARLIAAEHANIMQISQNRAAREVELEETEVDLLLETRGEKHISAIIESITDFGFAVKV